MWVLWGYLWGYLWGFSLGLSLGLSLGFFFGGDITGHNRAVIFGYVSVIYRSVAKAI